MEVRQAFSAIGSAVTGTGPAGGSVLIELAGMAQNSVDALLIENTGGMIASVIIPAGFGMDPAPFDPSRATYSLSAGAQVLVTDPVQVGASYALVSGSVSVTAGTIGEVLNINS